MAPNPSPPTRGSRRGRLRGHSELWATRLLLTAVLTLTACSTDTGDSASDPDGGADEGAAQEADVEEGYAQESLSPAYEELPQPRAHPPFSRDQVQVEAWHRQLDGEGLVGQLLMLRVFGGDIDEADARNATLYGVDTPREVLETYRPGGVILFRTDAGEPTGNLESPEQVRTFTDGLREVSDDLGPPLLVGIDQEGGVVDRIGHFGTPYPSAGALGGDLELAAQQAEITATELAALGVDINFAPVADIDTEERNPIIGDRAFSSDPEQVAAYVTTQLDAYEDSGVIAGLKHFPGHGDTTQDSHLTLPRVDADLDQLADRELVPFVAAIAHGAEAIMTAHLELPEVSGPGVPASMSPLVVTDLLRDDLGFEGVIVTDSLEMAGARHDRPDERVALDALAAGHDLLMLPPTPETSVEVLHDAIDDGEVDAELVADAVRRVLTLKASLQGQLEDRPGADVVGDHRDVTDE